MLDAGRVPLSPPLRQNRITQAQKLVLKKKNNLILKNILNKDQALLLPEKG
jgi:hypothetical protein